VGNDEVRNEKKGFYRIKDLRYQKRKFQIIAPMTDSKGSVKEKHRVRKLDRENVWKQKSFNSGGNT